EELQSTNEELQTAKEEMQSTNEELSTVNDELTHRNRDLGHLNDDLINLLGGLNIPIIMVNRDLVIRRYTPPAERLFNLIASDVGRPISHMRPNLDVEDLSELIARVVHTLTPVDMDVQDAEGHWYSMRIRPYITAENRIDGAALAMVDIDMVKRSAEQLKASRDYANAIVDTVWEPLIVLDRDLKFSRANAAFHRAFQTSEAKLLGRSFWEIDNARWDVPVLRARLPALLLRNTREQDLEVELKNADGSEAVYSFSAQRILWDGEHMQMLLLAIEDITERRRASQQAELLAREREARANAETASRMKDEFLAMLAHELRNPLAPVRNTLYILRKRLSDDPVARGAVEVSQRQVAHMARLLDDLLDVSRITRGRIQLRRELLELQSTLQNALAGCRARFEANEQTVTVALPDDTVYLDADPARMEQVFSNLLSNAAKYTERRGHIWISAEVAAGSAVIRIKDDGIGIAAEMLPRVFDLFAQVDRSLDRSRGGLGIGLTLVRSLVSLHGGTVEAHSPGLHQGSELVIRLPTIQLLHTAREAELPAEIPPAPPRSVLVVDDNEDAATTLETALAIHGHQVKTTHDPHEAIALALALKPDFILLDIGLPAMDGYAVAQRLREDAALDSTVIVAITGYGQDDDRQRSREAGIEHHLVKPVDMAEVARLLRDALPARTS
ncbi:MAG: PAS domain-containing protein, partial [Polyangiales bacterium]